MAALSDEVHWETAGRRGRVVISYRWSGVSTAPPVVCLHGSLMNSQFFRPLEAVSGQRFLLIDCPGHGLSDHVTSCPTDIPCDLPGAAAAIAELLSRLGIFAQPYVLCGHSWGGLLALQLVKIVPRAPLALISLEGNILPSDCSHNGPARTCAPLEPSQALTQKVLSVIKSVDKLGLWQNYLIQLGDSLGFLAPQLFKSLVDVSDSNEALPVFKQLPIRMILGEKSGKLPKMTDLIASHPDAQIQQIKGAGHFMLEESPRETCEAVSKFLAALPRRVTWNAILPRGLPFGSLGGQLGAPGFLQNFRSRKSLGNAYLLQLAKWNTPTIWNGWEQITAEDFGNSHFNQEPIQDHMPQMGPMVGYAVTVQIQPGNAAIGRDFAPGRQGFRDHVADIRDGCPGAPLIAVVQDLDRPWIKGSMWGEVNATLFRSLGVIGCLVDGGVRDIDEMCATGFHAFSRGVCIGHAFGGIPMRYDLPVTVFGCSIRPGQLLHVDKHGFLAVPEQDEGKILEASDFMDLLERKHTIRVGKDSQFSGKRAFEIAADAKQAFASFGEEKKAKYGSNL